MKPPGTAVSASTLRPPSALIVGQVATYSTHLASLTCRSIAGVLLQPVSAQFVQDTFGVQVVQPARVYADWPTGSSEASPVLPSDVLQLLQGEYIVQAVKNFAGSYLAIYVEIPLT